MAGLWARILTRSFPGKGAALEDAPRNERPQRRETEVGQYPSRALGLWLECLSDVERPQVLELGPLRSCTLAFMGEWGANLSVASLDVTQSDDLTEQLDRLDAPRDLDGALCWDFPNYFSATEQAALGGWAEQHIRPGGVVLLCLATKTPYAARPGRYAIANAEHLEYQPDEHAEHDRHQRVTASDLARHWPGFETLRSFLLRNGMQEYVLRRRSNN